MSTQPRTIAEVLTRIFDDPDERDWRTRFESEPDTVIDEALEGWGTVTDQQREIIKSNNFHRIQAAVYKESGTGKLAFIWVC